MWSEFISNELKSVYNPFHVVLRVTPSLLVSAMCGIVLEHAL